jgi:hypothetical protein
MATPANAEAPIRIAITPVLVAHYLEVNHELVAYVGEKLGRRAFVGLERSWGPTASR